MKFFESLVSFKPPKGMGTITAENFVTSATTAGLLRKDGESAYLTIGDNTLRVSHHNTSGKTYFVPSLNDRVILSEATAVSSGNHGGPDAKYNIIPVIPEMLKNSVLIQTEAHINKESKEKNIDSLSHLLAAKVRYDGERYIAVMVIHENNGIKYYDHAIRLVKEMELGGYHSNNVPVPSSTSILNVAQLALLSSGFLPDNEKNIKFSMPGDRGDTSLDPVDYRRSIDPLFDFFMEYSDNGILTPGRALPDEPEQK